MRRNNGSRLSLIYATECVNAYADYYTRLEHALEAEVDLCQYNDINYDAINFRDITRSKERSSILALARACVVKGRGPTLRSYDPQGRVSRAEFIKMLVKTYYIGKEFDVQPEGEPYE
jgi:hypothetical protein